jgi:hypothetical protein
MLLVRGISRVKDAVFYDAGEVTFATFVRCIAHVRNCENLDQCNNELFRI